MRTSVKNLGFDGSDHERRERIEGVVECPDCGEDVELVSETEEWVEGDDGRWHHNLYGPAVGSCCGNLIADSFEGCRVYRLRDGEGDR